MEGAPGLLQEMVHQLPTPNVVSWSAAIGVHHTREQWEGAFGLLQEMV